MSLVNLVQSVPDYANLTAEEIHAVIVAKSIRRTNPELQSWAGVGGYITQAGAAEMKYQLEQTLATPVPQGAEALYKLLAYAKWALDVGKLDFSLDDTQSALEVSRAFFESKGLPVDLLKRIGVWYEAPWEGVLNSEPTVEQVADVLAAMQRDVAKANARSAGASVYNNWASQIDQWNGEGDPPTLTIVN